MGSALAKGHRLHNRQRHRAAWRGSVSNGPQATQQVEHTIATAAYRLEKKDGKFFWHAPPSHCSLWKNGMPARPSAGRIASREALVMLPSTTTG